MGQPQNINRTAQAVIGTMLAAFLLASLISFDVCDWPNPDVAPASETHNWCGPVGAYLAYHCNYYFGPAIMVIVVAGMIWLIMRCMNKTIEQWLLRVIGVVLVGAVVSASSYLMRPGGPNSLSHGTGGVLGIAVAHFLLTNTAMTGAILILLATLSVGLLLSVDNIIFALPAVMAGALERFGRCGPLLAGVTAAGEKLRQQVVNDHVKKAVLLKERPRTEVESTLGLEEDIGEEDVYEYEEDQVEGDQEGAEVQDEQDKNSVGAVSTALAKMLGKCPEPASTADATEDFNDYKFPPLDLLAEPVHGFAALQEKVVREKGRILENTLREFNLDATVVEAETGPVITMFELQLAPGIKVARISSLANDLARSLGAAAVRVVAPIPGKHTIGIEVPNNEKEKVRIKELINMAGNRIGKMHIPLFLGKDGSGEALVVDLTALPHLLIAGTTGSGKSVCLNAIIVSILLTQRPDMVKLILVDPKMVEMNAYRDVAHLMCPIVTEMKRAEQILEWLTVKMDERYALFAEARVRNIASYNKLTEEQIYERFCPSNEQEKTKIPLRLPYLVIMIDELADLMMTSAKEVEAYIIRIAQKSRAVGIHIVLATQRPQATVVTGLIKSNLPARISFRVAARMDSRIVLDQNGAEALLGQGDMLFLQPGTSELSRAQGAFLSDDEIHRVVKHLKEVSQPHYSPELVQLNTIDAANMERDELFDQAVRIVLETKRGSVSLLQRRLTVGYSRASRLIDQMAAAGIVGEYVEAQAREVLLTPAEYEVVRKQMDMDARDGYSDLADDSDDAVGEVPGAGMTEAVDEGVRTDVTVAETEDIEVEDTEEADEESDEDEEDEVEEEDDYEYDVEEDEEEVDEDEEEEQEEQ